MKGVSYFSNFVRKLIINDYNSENLSILEDRDDKSLIHLTHEKNATKNSTHQDKHREYET